MEDEAKLMYEGSSEVPDKRTMGSDKQLAATLSAQRLPNPGR